MSGSRLFQLGHALVDSPLPPDEVLAAIQGFVDEGVRVEGMVRPLRRVGFRGRKPYGFALECGELGVAMRGQWTASAQGGSSVHVWADPTVGEASSVGPALVVAGSFCLALAVVAILAALTLHAPWLVDPAKVLGFGGPIFAGLGWLRFRMWRDVAKYTLVPFRQAIAEKLRGQLLPEDGAVPASRPA